MSSAFNHVASQVGAFPGEIRLPRSSFRYVPLGLWALTATAFGVWSLFDADALYGFFGALASLVVSVPMVMPGYRLGSMWTPVALVLYYSYGFRGAIVSFAVEPEGVDHDSLYLLGGVAEDFVAANVLAVTAFTLMTVTYMAFSASGAAPRPLRAYRFDERSVKLVTIGLSVLGFIGFVMYARATGGFSLETLSAKRASIGGLDLGDDYRGYNDLRFLGGFSAIAFWVWAGHLGFRSRSSRLNSAARLSLLLHGCNSVLLPFYSSVRAGAFITVVVGFLVFYACAGRRPRPRLVVIGAVVVSLALGLMSVLREEAQTAQINEGSRLGAAISAFVEDLIANRNFGGMFVFGNIVNYVPERMSFKDGDTLLGWLVAWVPRGVWPDKPLISVGPEVGVRIYGTVATGIPPGLLGDGYLNFGVSGVLLVAVSAGLLLALTNKAFSMKGNDPGLTTLYFSGVFLGGYYMLNQGIGYAVFSVAGDVIPTFAALLLAGKWVEIKAHQPAPR